jgi:hypothetical protein
MSMETPVKVDLQGDNGLERARPTIEKHLEDLGKRFGRITACRVALRQPSAHHKTGGLYEISVYLALPNGRSVTIDRTPTLDERHSDLMFAVNDAFKRARRRLQGQAHRLQGRIKQHERRPPAS